MSTATLKELHNLIDVVDPSEYEIIFRLLLKFIPEDLPLADEIEAIKELDLAIANGELLDESAIDWN